MMRSAGLLIVAIIGASTTLAEANISTYKCQIHFPTEQDTLDIIPDIFAAVDGDAVERCAIPGEPATVYYWSVFPVVEGPIGVCTYEKRRVFLKPEKNRGSTWTFSPPKDEEYLAEPMILMMENYDGCGAQGDPRYVAVSGVTEGVFLALVQFWDRFSSSTNEFDKVIDRAPSDVQEFGILNPLRSAIENDTAARLEVKIWSIHITRTKATTSDVTAIAHYALDITGGTLGSWSLIVDFEDGEVRLLGVSTIEY